MHQLPRVFTSTPLVIAFVLRLLPFDKTLLSEISKSDAMLDIAGYQKDRGVILDSLFTTWNIPNEEKLYIHSDPRAFVESARPEIHEGDRDYWDIMGAMYNRFPDQMERWITGTPLFFDLCDMTAKGL